MHFRYLLLFILVCIGLDAKMFQSIQKEHGTFVQSGEAKYYCLNCGMNLVKFYKTSHVHTNHQYCSLHCLYGATQGEVPKDVKVVDANTLKLIDAKDAHYVVGSEVKGTMTFNSKYAFGNLEDAKKFKNKYGGKIVNFEEAYAIAAKDFKKDMKMIMTKKTKKVYKVGKKLYDKKCENVEPGKFSSIAALKAEVKKHCQKARGDKELQAISVYLWDIKRENKALQKAKHIEVPKDAKCPVCGMFVYKYPKWATVIEDGDKKYYFDGAKDMFKYYLLHKNKIESAKIYVTDYFSGKKIEAKYAYYVMGSNVYGPMGNELIPFYSELDANAFKKDHFGMKVFSFMQVVEDKEVMEDLEEL